MLKDLKWGKSLKNNFIAAGLILALGVGGAVTLPVSSHVAYASSIEDKIKSLDTSQLEIQVSAAKYLLENFPKTVNKQTRAKLEGEVKRAEGLIAKANELKARYKSNDNLNIRVKNLIRPNLAKRNEEFTISVKGYTTNEQIQDWFLETAKEDWYFFYSMYEKANISTKYNPKKTQGNKMYIDSVTFNVKYRASGDIDRQIDTYTTEWVNSNILSSDSNYDKALKIHDFIVTKNQYNRGDNSDMSGGYSIYHPASIIYGNGGVCNAYATLFDKIATKAGLEVRYATGTSKKTGEPHIWNMVKIDGNWYNIDTTWDDPAVGFSDGYVVNIEDFVIYDYFLKSDADIEGSRIIDNDPNRPVSVMTMNTGLQKPTIQKIGGEYRVVK